MGRVPFRRVIAHGATIAAAVTAAVGCTTDGNNGTGPNGDNSAISISLNVSSASVEQAGFVVITASVTRSGGFTGSVTFTLDGAPPGVTGSASDMQTSGTVTTAIVTISVDGAVQPGVYNFTVRASGDGVANTTAPFELTVEEQVGFTLTLNPNALTIQKGMSGASQLAIGRINLPDPIDLTLEDLPEDASGRPGVTGAIDPTTVTGDAATVSLTVAQGLAAGLYTITVRGTSNGERASTSLALTVTDTPDFNLALNPTTISIQQGSSAQVAVTISRANFTDTVTLSLSGAPSGVTGAFAPAATTGTVSTLTVSVDGAAAAGDYTLTVTGSSSLGDRTVDLPLTVTTP